MRTGLGIGYEVDLDKSLKAGQNEYHYCCHLIVPITLSCAEQTRSSSSDWEAGTMTGTVTGTGAGIKDIDETRA